MKYITKDSPQFFAFNVWDTESARAIIDAGGETEHGVILQTSARVFKQLPAGEFAAWVRSYAGRRGVPAYLHLDHCSDLQEIAEAIGQGWNSVMLDASRLPLTNNIVQTRQVTAIAHQQGVLVEAEVGAIGKATDAEIATASWEDIDTFLAQTEVDLFAAAIGTAHGLYHGTPHLDFDLIRRIGQRTEIPFVIHGGTGLSKATFQQLLACPNVKKINISTDVKQAYRRGILRCEQEHQLEEAGFEATRVEQSIYKEIKEMARQKLELL